MRKYTCGVPKEHCFGSSNFVVNITSITKIHCSSEEAFNCHARWLVNVLGYKRIGSREFDLQNGSPIRVLTKKSRFGGVLRIGKHGEGAKTKRLVPRHNALGGLIASY